jgi:hypothetical protein
MDVLEAIRSRRTVKLFHPEPVSHPLIEQVLEAAVWAPNHRLTEPWQFVVIEGNVLLQLAELRRRMTVEYLETQTGRTEEQIAREGEDAYRKALAAPATIVVHIDQHADPVIREEDHLATAAAIQNMMLAAHGLGLAAFWSTNNLLHYPRRTHCSVLSRSGGSSASSSWAIRPSSATSAAPPPPPAPAGSRSRTRHLLAKRASSTRPPGPIGSGRHRFKETEQDRSLPSTRRCPRSRGEGRRSVR